MNTDMTRRGPFLRTRIVLAAGAILIFGAGCGEIDVSDGITEVGALNTAGLSLEPTADATPRADIALDFTAGDVSDDSEAASLRDGREAPPDPTATPTKKPKASEDDEDEDEDDDDETSTTRSEVEEVEDESEVLIARGTYHADVKEGTALKVRSEPEGKQIDRITPDIAVKATGEGTTIDKVTWAQIRPLGDAEWDIGWVVFEHLANGEPDVDPTPTLEPVEQAAATSPPAPTSPPPPPSNPDPTATPEPDPPAEPDSDDSKNDESDNKSDSDKSDSDKSDSDKSDSDKSDSDESESDKSDDKPKDDTVSFNALGDAYTIRDDTDLREEADPSSSVLAVVRKGADAVVANDNAYRYNGVLYVQVNVVGVLGWVDARQLQEY